MPRKLRTFISFGLVLVAPTACYSGVEEGAHAAPSTGEPSETPMDDDSDDDSGGSDDGGSSGEPDGSACASGELELSVPSPMRRLTRAEYDNTIRDLLGQDTHPAAAFLPDEKAGSFDANNVAAVSSSHVRAYITASKEIAAVAVDRDLDAWLGCEATDSSCVEAFLAAFIRRAYRHSPTDEELSAALEVFETGRTEEDPRTGLRNAIAATLSSPSFLYIVEVGEPVEEGSDILRLTSYELASRLSYFLWSSMPDDELLDMAEAGGLDTRAGIEEQARRMLDDDLAADTLELFHAQWLEVDHLSDAAKDPELFPSWDPQFVASARAEQRHFVDHIIRDGDGRLETLLTAPYSFVDEDLAVLYGVPAPTVAFEQVQLDPSLRSGLLTQSAFLAAHAYPAVPSEIHRGKFVREQLLCQTLPPPPDDVDATLPSSQRLMDPACSACHLLMDPIGYGFDGYDAVGAVRLEDAERNPVSSEGEVMSGGSADGPFDGARELSERLVEMQVVHDCYVDRWIEFATRSEAASDGCTVQRARAAYADSDQDIVEMIVSLTTSDDFRFRRLEQG